MPKKSIFPLIALCLLMLAVLACASTGNGTGLALQDVIEQTGEKIAGELPKGSRVAIVVFESANDNLSDYIDKMRIRR